MLLFVARSKDLSIYHRLYPERAFKLVKEYFYEIYPNLKAKNSTLICNQDYFYKAFGMFEAPFEDKSIILRLKISDPYKIEK